MSSPGKSEYQAFLWAIGETGFRDAVDSRVFDDFDNDDDVKREAVSWAAERTRQNMHATIWLELTKDGKGIFTQSFENKYAQWS